MSPPCGTKGWYRHEHRARKNVMLTHWSGATITCFTMIFSWIILIFPRSRGLKKKKKNFIVTANKSSVMIVLIYFGCFYDTSHGDSSRGAVGGVAAGARAFVCMNIISPSLFVIIFASSPERDVTRRFLTFGTRQKANISSLHVWFLYLLKIHFQSLSLCPQTWTLVVSSCKNWRTAARPIKPEDQRGIHFFFFLWLTINLLEFVASVLCFYLLFCTTDKQHQLDLEYYHIVNIEQISHLEENTSTQPDSHN